MTTHAAALDRGGMDATELGMGVYNMKLGMWVFLLSEVMFFTSLIGSYIILRSAHPDMFAQPGVVLNVPLTALNTFLLICSSVTMVLAFAAIERGDQSKLKAWLVATALIGMCFLGVQVYEYIHLSSDGFVPFVEGYHAEGAPLYGSTFYTMTGFHGFHVFVGVLALWYLVIQAFRGKYTVANHGAVEITGLYWHFVDLVWIILFTIVYLI